MSESFLPITRWTLSIIAQSTACVKGALPCPRYASTQATELKDGDTADLFTEIARGIDKWLWFVETSQQSAN